MTKQVTVFVMEEPEKTSIRSSGYLSRILRYPIPPQSTGSSSFVGGNQNRVDKTSETKKNSSWHSVAKKPATMIVIKFLSLCEKDNDQFSFLMTGKTLYFLKAQNVWGSGRVTDCFAKTENPRSSFKRQHINLSNSACVKATAESIVRSSLILRLKLWAIAKPSPR